MDNNQLSFEAAKTIYNSSNNKEVLEALETVFPQLRENEDEKIRKELINWLKNTEGQVLPIDRYNAALAWLEKQDNEKPVPDWMPKFLDELRLKKHYFDWDERKDIEGQILAIIEWMDPNYFNGKDGGQKPVIEMKSAEESLGISSEEYNDIVNECLYGESNSSDKKEPKFKVGDWITNGDYTWKVIKVEQFDYILQSQDGNIVDDTIFHVDKQFHLWIIKDAKDGDVLVASDRSIFIFKEVCDSFCKHYIALTSDKEIQVNTKLDKFWETARGVKPSTKEQRDTLLKAMADAGYTFDFDKKELKKIEKISQRMVSAEAKEALYDKLTDEEMKELLRTEYEKGRADTLSEMKSSWSEEDEDVIGMAIIALEDMYDEDAPNTTYGGYNLPFNKAAERLKSLKDRVIPQLKQEWSEEDDDIIEEIEAIIDAYVLEEYNPKVLIDWCKSLKDRYTWKPSKGQLECLSYAIDKAEKDYSPLTNNRIYLTLKTLKEELEKL